MADKPKDRSLSTPQGTFGAPAVKARPVTSPPASRPSSPPISFPPVTVRPPAGAEEVVLDDIENNVPGRSSSSFPAPLGQSEQHDAWTVERLSRQSTVPPVRHDDVDRLRKLSAIDGDEISGGATGGALDLVDRSRPSQQLDLTGEMEELYALDDLTGALRHAELILGRQPDHEQAKRCAANCRKRLIALYSSKLGSVDGIVTVVLTESQLRWLGLDHRAGFLLSRVDGLLSVEELLDVCGMQRLEGLKTLVDLLERGAIRVRRP